MSEEQTTNDSPVEEPVVDEGVPGAEQAPESVPEAEVQSSEIMAELTVLGQKVVAAVQQAWESDERKKAEAEIRHALRLAGERIDEVTADVQSSEVTEDLKGQAAKLKDSVQESSVAKEVQRGLLVGLRKLNDELGRLLEKNEGTGVGAEAPAEPAATPMTDVSEEGASSEAPVEPTD